MQSGYIYFESLYICIKSDKMHTHAHPQTSWKERCGFAMFTFKFHFYLQLSVYCPEKPIISQWAVRHLCIFFFCRRLWLVHYMLQLIYRCALAVSLWVCSLSSLHHSITVRWCLRPALISPEGTDLLVFVSNDGWQFLNTRAFKTVGKDIFRFFSSFNIFIFF